MGAAARGVFRALLVALLLGSCADASNDQAEQVLRRVSSLEFPGRYVFDAVPRADTPVDCLLTHPRFSGQVDTTGGRAQLEVGAPTRGLIVVDDGNAYVEAPLLRRLVVDGWLRIGAQTGGETTTPATEAIGPVLAPFIDPPALPADPNTIVTEAAATARSIRWLGTRVQGERSLEGIRLVLDEGELPPLDEVTTTDASTLPVVEAWADADGMVRELTIGRLAEEEILGGYTTSYAQAPAVDIDVPDGPWITSADLASAPQVRPDCELSVGT